MKLCEFKPCSACNLPLGSEGGITFYRVSLEHFVVMVDAVRRQYGLELMLGSSALAAVMGPDEDLAKRANHTPGILVCQDCAGRVTLAELMEGSAPTTDAPVAHG